MKTTLLKCFGVLGIAFSTAALAAPPPTTEPTKDAISSPLTGDYAIVSGEKNGQALPADRVKGSLVSITSGTITGTDKDKKEFFACTYTLDTRAEPWVIRMKSTAPKAGSEAMGLVKQSADGVTIIYALPGGEMPTEFKTKDKQHMFVLKSSRVEVPPALNKFQPGGE